MALPASVIQRLLGLTAALRALAEDKDDRPFERAAVPRGLKLNFRS
jgi:hypothetical protein